MIFFSIWSFGSMMMHLNSPVMTPLFWNKVMLVGLLSAPFALSHFIIDILDLRNRSIRGFVYASYLLIIPLMILNFSGNIVDDVGICQRDDVYYRLASRAVFAYAISYC
jgi:hypothetical protein